MHPQQEIVDLTKTLIRIPSTHSRPLEIQHCADLIADWLDARHILYRRREVNGTPSILVLPRSDDVPVLYMTHFDVVETADEALFEPWESQGRLYGRGAVDDKYAVALSLVLFHRQLEELRQSGKDQSEMNFGLLLTGDEEVGGANGVGAALEMVAPDFFIALDGGGPDQIVIREKGILQLQLSARGKAAHGARPWLGENAFDHLVADYHAIGHLFGDLPADGQGDHWHPTLVLSNCQVGDGCISKVPETATATLDIRYTEKEDPDELLAAVRSVVAHSRVSVHAKEPLFIGGESAYLDRLLETAPGLTTISEHGSSDARYFSAKGIPGIVWGADGEMSQHSEDEHVVIASIGSLYHRLSRFQASLVGRPGG